MAEIIRAPGEKRRKADHYAVQSGIRARKQKRSLACDHIHRISLHPNPPKPFALCRAACAFAYSRMALACASPCWRTKPTASVCGVTERIKDNRGQYGLRAAPSTHFGVLCQTWLAGQLNEKAKIQANRATWLIPPLTRQAFDVFFFRRRTRRQPEASFPRGLSPPPGHLKKYPNSEPLWAKT